jgi:hypothetical protein
MVYYEGILMFSRPTCARVVLGKLVVQWSLYDVLQCSAELSPLLWWEGMTVTAYYGQHACIVDHTLHGISHKATPHQLLGVGLGWPNQFQPTPCLQHISAVWWMAAEVPKLSTVLYTA